MKLRDICLISLILTGCSGKVLIPVPAKPPAPYVPPAYDLVVHKLSENANSSEIIKAMVIDIKHLEKDNYVMRKQLDAYK